MIKGKNILCFGSENWEYPGFQQTIMRKLSSDNRIIYVNSIGTREIRLQYSQFSFYFNRAIRIFRRSHNTQKNTIVCNPWIIPLIYNSLITKCNKQLIRLQFSRLLNKANFKDYILWIGTPSAANLIDLFNPIITVYNPVDRYCAFPFVNNIKIREYEKQIAKKSDLIICTSDSIKNDFISYNESSITFTHGVEFDHFYSAINNNTIPSDIKKIRKPIIGYFGSLSVDILNFDLLIGIAAKYPSSSIVLIGRKNQELDRLAKIRNIHILGFKKFEILPLYLKQFDVCLIPFHINLLMEGVDPIKLREYLSLGKPVVSVALPEVTKLKEVVYVANTIKDFLIFVGKALKEDNKRLVSHRIHIAKQSDWGVKMEQLSKIVCSFIKQNTLKN